MFHANRPTGDLVNRVTGDVNAVGDLFTQTLGTLASASLVLVGMFAVTFWLDPLLAFVAFLVTPLLLATTMHYQKRIRQMARSQRAKEGEIASLATEALSAMQVIKAFGTERFEHDRVQRTSAERLAGGRGELPRRGALRCPRRRARGGRDRARSRPRRDVRRRRSDQPGRPGRRRVLHQQALQAAQGHREAGQPRRTVPGPARAHRRDPVVGHGAGRRHRRLEARPPGGGHGPARRRALPVRREPTGVERGLPARAQGLPARARRRVRRRQVDGRCPRGALLRPLARLRLDRRPRRPVVAVALGAQPGRGPAPGHDPLQRQRPGQHRLRDRRRHGR